MKIFKLMTIALVAMCGLNSCSEDCDHDFIEYDYNKALVGTWTYLADNGQAEAMVIKENGSFVITGINGNGDLYEEKGNIKVVHNKVTLAYEDGNTFEGRLELVSGKSMSIVFNKDYDICLTYDYCQNDLSDEILGMWVCNETPTPVENDMLIINYKADGSTLFSGYFYEARDFWVNAKGSYKVIGDLLFHRQPDNALETGVAQYSVMKLIYAPNANSYGDLMYLLANARVGENFVPATTTWLRVKQHLDLPGTTYDYSSVYISNAKGSEFTIMDYTFNASLADGSRLDGMLKHLLFCVEFPTANTIKYKYRYNDKDVPFEAPIDVDGNKVTIDMSVINSAYRKVEMYMFQDADNSQLHMYMPTTGFINYFANIQLTALNAEGKIDLNDATAVEKVFADLEACVESINLSLVMKVRK
jgi:hypothetical protein